MKNLKGILFVLCMMVFTACAKSGADQPSEANSNEESTVTLEPTITGEATTEEVTTGDAAVVAEIAVKDKMEIKIAALKGPTAIGMVKVMEDADAGTTTNIYNFTIAGTADEISTGLIKGDIDIAAIPCNLASVLYNKTEGMIKIAGINTLGGTLYRRDRRHNQNGGGSKGKNNLFHRTGYHSSINIKLFIVRLWN